MESGNFESLYKTLLNGSVKCNVHTCAKIFKNVDEVIQHIEEKHGNTQLDNINRGKKSKIANTEEEQTIALKVYELLDPTNEISLDDCEKVDSYFADVTGRCFAWIENKDLGYFHSLGLEDHEFENFASLLYFQQNRKIANKDSIKNAVGLVRAQVSHNPSTEYYDLKLRYARSKNEIFIDTGSPDFRIWRITPDPEGKGVKEEKQSEIIFKRYTKTRELLRPDLEAYGKEKLEALIKFYKLKDKNDVILVSGFFGACMIADIPHPLLDVYGPQGSTKSSFEKAIKKALDPTAADTVTLSHSLNELIQTLAHNYITVFDNISSISQGQFDVLCRVCTGESDSKRALYENDVDFVYAQFFHVPFLNGINDLVKRPDASERSLRIELERVSEKERLTEFEASEKLQSLIPQALGAAYHGLSKALYLLKEVRQDLQGKLPRMADFAVWGEAFCQALGYEKNRFFNQYLENLKKSSQAALENNGLVELIGDLVGSQAESKWEGKPSDLLVRLQEYDRENYNGMHSKNKQLPKSANKLTERLFELAEDLKVIGYTIVRSHTSDKSAQRRITIEYTSQSKKINRQNRQKRQKDQNPSQKKADSSDGSKNQSSEISNQSSEKNDENPARKHVSDDSDASDDSFSCSEGQAPQAYLSQSTLRAVNF